jgi:hypothetical protein
VPGFLNAHRWIGTENPKISVATYDLDNVGVLHSPPYLAVGGDNGSPWTKRTAKFRKSILRYEGEQAFPGDRTAPSNAPALFMIGMNVAPEHEHEFNEWYNTEHLPELLSLPGFLDAARYVAYKGTPKYLAVYELESAEALKTAEFQKWRANPSPWSRRISPSVVGKNLSRTIGQQIFPANPELPERGMAAALQIGRMSVPESADREWNEWYNGEYIPGYRKVAGVIYARRYRVVEGDTRYATVYEFEHEKVSETDEWNKQREGSSPRSGRMRDVMTHLQGSPGVYRRIYPQ